MTDRWLTETNICQLPLPSGGLKLRCGRALSEVALAYEAY